MHVKQWLNEIVRIILERISDVDGDFDAKCERIHLRGLLDHDYVLSTYGLTAASNHSQRSSASQLTAKRADVAVGLAANEAEYEAVLEEQQTRQREKTKALEEGQKKQMEAQNAELERLRAQKEM